MKAGKKIAQLNKLYEELSDLPLVQAANERRIQESRTDKLAQADAAISELRDSAEEDSRKLVENLQQSLNAARQLGVEPHHGDRDAELPDVSLNQVNDGMIKCREIRENIAEIDHYGSSLHDGLLKSEGIASAYAQKVRRGTRFDWFARAFLLMTIAMGFPGGAATLILLLPVTAARVTFSSRAIFRRAVDCPGLLFSGLKRFGFFLTWFPAWNALFVLGNLRMVLSSVKSGWDWSWLRTLRFLLGGAYRAPESVDPNVFPAARFVHDFIASNLTNFSVANVFFGVILPFVIGRWLMNLGSRD